MTAIPQPSLPDSPGGAPPRSAEEMTRFNICLVISLVIYAAPIVLMAWLFHRVHTVVIVGLVAVACIIWLVRLVARDFFVGHIRGNGVLVGPAQLPHILASAQKACSRFRTPLPEIYVVQFGKLRQAVAEFFLSSRIVVLSSQLAQECGQSPQLDFLLARQIGHIALRHHWWHFILAPSAILPLAYAAWRRATEYTADLCGLAVCGELQPAQHATLISAVGHLAGQVHLPAYHADLPDSGGFWTTIRQLRAYHPDVNWRLGRLAAAAGQAPSGPRRSAFATVLCAFMPGINPQVHSFGGVMAAVAIMALMVAWMLPTLVMARHQALRSFDASQLHSYNNALRMYMNENDDWLPPNLATLKRSDYLGTATRREAVDVQYVPQRSCRFSQVENPYRVVVLYCQVGNACIAGFLDGHIESMSESQLDRALDMSQDAFNRAAGSEGGTPPRWNRRRN
jgi:Zn-dependent protease with chaperone function